MTFQMFFSSARPMSLRTSPGIERSNGDNHIIRLHGVRKRTHCQSTPYPQTDFENGLKNEQISLRQQAVSEVIQRYTREAGVRNLEREISKICRKVATQIVTKQTKQKVIVNQKRFMNYLEPQI